MNQNITFTWDCLEWLENNFTTDNGLPGFFSRGQYSYQYKFIAETEFKQALDIATSSSNNLFARWADGIISKGFSVLKNNNIQNYWSDLLTTELRQQQLDQYSAYLLNHLNALPSSLLPSPPGVSSTKRVAEEQQHNVSSRQRIDFQERDAFYIEGLSMSVGTFIGQLARNSRSSQERRNQYFTALGMNGVLDINDTLSGGQLHAILNRMNDDRSNETPSYSTDGLKALMGPLIYGVLPPTPGPVFHLEQQLKENVIDQIEKDDRQWKKWYEVIKKQSIEGDKSERYIDSYIHIIKLHMYHPTLFGNSMTLSEQDYVIKIWYGFVETFFRCTDIEAHWGDTIPNIVLIYGIAMRMDSQPLDIINKSAPVYGIDEFEEEVFSSNYYKDKLKAVLSVKAHLNYLLTCNNIPDDEVNKIKYPFMLVAGFEIELYSLHLAAPGLYVLNSIHSAYFPTTVKEANEGSIKAVVSLLDCFKTICLNIKTYQKVRNETHQVNRRKSMNDRTNDTRRHSNSKSISSSTAPASSSNTSVDSTKWTRDIWDPK